jgi:hypothetical protein
MNQIFIWKKLNAQLFASTESSESSRVYKVANVCTTTLAFFKDLNLFFLAQRHVFFLAQRHVGWFARTEGSTDPGSPMTLNNPSRAPVPLPRIGPRPPEIRQNKQSMINPKKYSVILTEEPYPCDLLPKISTSPNWSLLVMTCTGKLSHHSLEISACVVRFVPD